MNSKIHPWRKCPLGQHWRKGNPMRTRSGNVVQRRGGCVQNRSGKDQIYTDEMELISQSEFDQLSGLPAGKRLGFSQGSKFDREIRGWCKYWNDVLGGQETIMVYKGYKRLDHPQMLKFMQILQELKK